MMSTSFPLRYDVQVPSDGRIEVTVPLPPGSLVTVYVTEPSSSEAQDLLSAAGSSAEFWDNPFDDEDWNDA